MSSTVSSDLDRLSSLSVMSGNQRNWKVGPMYAYVCLCMPMYAYVCLCIIRLDDHHRPNNHCTGM